MVDRVDVDMKRPARGGNMGGRREGGGDRGGDRGGGRRDDRDRDRGYREDRGGDRGDEADRWARAPRQEQPPVPPPRSSSSSYRSAPVSDRPSHNRRPDYSRDDRGGSDAGDAATLTIPASTTRPIIKIQPRTLPVETVGQPIAASQSIFGGAKPRDEKAYEEERKKKLEAERAVAEKAAAEKAGKEGTSVEAMTSTLAASSITEGDKTTIPSAVAAGAADEEPRWSNYPPERDGGRGRGAGRGQQGSNGRGPPPVKQQSTR